MILLPYGHEQTTVRRLPWVTLGIVALCIVAFALSGRWRTVPREDERIQDDVQSAVEWYSERPYLMLSDDFEETFFGGGDDEPTLFQALGYLGEVSGAKPPLDLLLEEQEHLDTLTARAVDGFRNHTFRRWGLVPGAQRLPSWLSHMFLHAGWLHLLGNLFILLLAGPFIEDVWGRPIYAGFYLTSGLVAALFHILSGPDSTTPMVGASGAIAGVMGAFLMRYGTTRIKFFYIIFLVVRGTFRAPAWLMLPLWFVSQLWMGMLFSGLNAEAGVAYWAHVGGFVVGVATAWIIKAKRIEERYVDSRIESKITFEVEDNRTVVEALDARDRDPELAFRMLSLAVMDQPKNHDAASALWDLGKQLQRTDETAPLILRSIVHQLRTDGIDLALDQWLDVLQAAPDVRGDPRQFVRLAQALIERERHEDALVTLRLAMRPDDGRLDATLAWTIVRIARDIAPSVARSAAEFVLEAAEAEPDLRRRARQVLEDLSTGSDAQSIPLAT